jgi:hypothetical protein
MLSRDQQDREECLHLAVPQDVSHADDVVSQTTTSVSEPGAVSARHVGS